MINTGELPALFSLLIISIYAMWMIWCPPCSDIHVLRVIVSFAYDALPPMCVTSGMKSPRPLFEKSMIIFIFTDYENRIIVLSKRMMNLHFWRERLAQYFFSLKGMLIYIFVLGFRMLWLENPNVQRCSDDSTFPWTRLYSFAVMGKVTHRFSLNPSLSFTILRSQSSKLATSTVTEALWNRSHGISLSLKYLTIQGDI